ncbi:MAG: hypothetical protein CM15mP63_2340 [Gammaproteobacteria bacterium]|nr:MAG: hypothetical protein CM15mP63_2340 [Gammaproteobacteria bacterium]
MGGLIIIVSILISTLLWADINNKNIWILIFVLITFGLIGFYDDYKNLNIQQAMVLKARQNYYYKYCFLAL